MSVKYKKYFLQLSWKLPWPVGDYGKYKKQNNAVTVVWSIVAQRQSHIRDYNQAAVRG